MKQIVIFGSGKGSNLQNILNYFVGSCLKVRLVVSDKPNSGCLDIAKCRSIPSFFINDWESIEKKIKIIQPDLIVLAGFLKKIPKEFIENCGCPIVNIHPSLLPKFGGKGMYGKKVHQAVIDGKESKSGITIHFVNENYDEGNIIFQKEIDLWDGITVEDLEIEIHKLEKEWFPKVIQEVLGLED